MITDASLTPPSSLSLCALSSRFDDARFSQVTVEVSLSSPGKLSRLLSKHGSRAEGNRYNLKAKAFVHAQNKRAS